MGINVLLSGVGGLLSSLVNIIVLCLMCVWFVSGLGMAIVILTVGCNWLLMASPDNCQAYIPLLLYLIYLL